MVACGTTGAMAEDGHPCPPTRSPAEDLADEEWTGPSMPPAKVTLGLVMEHSLLPKEHEEFEQMDAEAALEKATTLTKLHLEWLGISAFRLISEFMDS